MTRWTDVERARYRAMTLARQPWGYSTGPRTAKGKAASAKNSTKDGRYSATALRLRRYLATVTRMLAKCG
jgi:hypothetical protein